MNALVRKPKQRTSVPVTQLQFLSEHSYGIDLSGDHHALLIGHLPPQARDTTNQLLHVRGQSHVVDNFHPGRIVNEGSGWPHVLSVVLSVEEIVALID